jgi:hypothetical protein
VKRLRIVGLLAVGLLVASTAAQADPVTLTLTGAGSNVMANVFIGPYTARDSSGNAFPIICDDFASDSYINETWTANVSTFADLSGTKFDAANPDGYEQAAWLSNKLLDPTVTGATAGAIQFAIWQIFTPTAFNSLSGTDLTNAQRFLWQAQHQTYTAGEFSNYVVLTPTSAAPTCLINGVQTTCPTAPPQEFITRVPEPATLPLIAIGFAALFLVHRRRPAAQA